jgi:hypothetical protein
MDGVVTQLVGDYAVSILLFCCAGLLAISILATVVALRSLRKNESLVELLLSESKRHTASMLTLSERLNNQYYVHQERVSIEHTATLRELLSSLSPQESKREGA